MLLRPCFLRLRCALAAKYRVAVLLQVKCYRVSLLKYWCFYMDNLLIKACLTSDKVSEPKSRTQCHAFAAPLRALVFCYSYFNTIWAQRVLATIHPAAITGVKYPPSWLSGTAVSVVMGLCVPMTLQVVPEQRWLTCFTGYCPLLIYVYGLHKQRRGAIPTLFFKCGNFWDFTEVCLSLYWPPAFSFWLFFFFFPCYPFIEYFRYFQKSSNISRQRNTWQYDHTENRVSVWSFCGQLFYITPFMQLQKEGWSWFLT